MKEGEQEKEIKVEGNLPVLKGQDFKNSDRDLLPILGTMPISLLRKVTPRR